MDDSSENLITQKKANDFNDRAETEINASAEASNRIITWLIGQKITDSQYAILINLLTTKGSKYIPKSPISFNSGLSLNALSSALSVNASKLNPVTHTESIPFKNTQIKNNFESLKTQNNFLAKRVYSLYLDLLSEARFEGIKTLSSHLNDTEIVVVIFQYFAGSLTISDVSIEVLDYSEVEIGDVYLDDYVVPRAPLVTQGTIAVLTPKNIKSRMQIVNIILPGSEIKKVPQSDRSKAPYNSVVELELHYDGSLYTGTGFLIDSQHIATAAHNLYDKKTSKRATKITAKFLDDTTIEVSSFTYPKGYESSTNHFEFDYGLVKLQSAKSDVHVLLFDALSDSALNNTQVSATGFYDDTDLDLNTSVGKITTVKTNTLEYNASTRPGTSGGPIISRATGKVIAIHDGAALSDESNEGNRVTATLAAAITKFKEDLATY